VPVKKKSFAGERQGGDKRPGGCIESGAKTQKGQGRPYSGDSKRGPVPAIKRQIENRDEEEANKEKDVQTNQRKINRACWGKMSLDLETEGSNLD